MPAICSVLNTFFSSAITSARTLPPSGTDARVTEVHVLADRQIQRVAGDDSGRSLSDAVTVEIQVGTDVHRQPAVELQQHADFVAAEQRADQRVRRRLLVV